MTHAWAAAGSTGGLGLPETVVLRFRYSQPKLNGTGRAGPFTWTRWVSAGNGVRPWFGRHGETRQGGGVETRSCSSKISIPSWPSGYHGGRPVVAGQVNPAWLTLESRQT